MRNYNRCVVAIVPSETSSYSSATSIYSLVYSTLLTPLKIADTFCRLSTWKLPKEQVWRWNDIVECALLKTDCQKLSLLSFTEVSRRRKTQSSHLIWIFTQSELNVWHCAVILVSNVCIGNLSHAVPSNSKFHYALVHYQTLIIIYHKLFSEAFVLTLNGKTKGD